MAAEIVDVQQSADIMPSTHGIQVYRIVESLGLQVIRAILTRVNDWRCPFLRR